MFKGIINRIIRSGRFAYIKSYRWFQGRGIKSVSGWSPVLNKSTDVMVGTRNYGNMGNLGGQVIAGSRGPGFYASRIGVAAAGSVIGIMGANIAIRALYGAEDSLDATITGGSNFSPSVNAFGFSGYDDNNQYQKKISAITSNLQFLSAETNLTPESRKMMVRLAGDVSMFFLSIKNSELQGLACQTIQDMLAMGQIGMTYQEAVDSDTLIRNSISVLEQPYDLDEFERGLVIVSECAGNGIPLTALNL